MKQFFKCTLLLVAFFCSSSCTERGPSRARLVLMITVDQLTQEYLTRFAPLFTGGLKYLSERGAQFSQVYYTHADTSTCPGHSVIATGVQPARSGIVGNWWYDREGRRTVYCVDDDRYGRSPRKLLVSSLPDWVQENSWWGKVYSASAKDRAAIMLGGKKADAAFWYDKQSGEMTSSVYYDEASPNWLGRFNREKRTHNYFGKPWEPLPVSSLDLQRMRVLDLDRGVFSRNFPHPVGGASVSPDESFYDSLYRTPFVDEYVAQFAQVLIREEELGQDSRLDYLGLSFSALDSVGHGYGPNSREVLDTLLRLDASLGNLFTYIDRQIGLGNVLIVLSSDHGVQPMPEYLKTEGISAHRQDATDVACFQQVGLDVSKEYGVENIFLSDLYLDRVLIAKHGLPLDEITNRVRIRLEACPMVEKVWTREELESTGEPASDFHLLYRRSYHPQRSADFLLQLKHHHLNSLHDGTSHGSPYDYDTHVPLIIAGPGIPKKELTNRVAVVDIAPTVAELLGIEVPATLDGKDRSALILRGG